MGLCCHWLPIGWHHVTVRRRRAPKVIHADGHKVSCNTGFIIMSLSHSRNDTSQVMLVYYATLQFWIKCQAVQHPVLMGGILRIDASKPTKDMKKKKLQ